MPITLLIHILEIDCVFHNTTRKSIKISYPKFSITNKCVQESTSHYLRLKILVTLEITFKVSFIAQLFLLLCFIQAKIIFNASIRVLKLFQRENYNNLPSSSQGNFKLSWFQFILKKSTYCYLAFFFFLFQNPGFRRKIVKDLDPIKRQCLP